MVLLPPNITAATLSLLVVLLLPIVASGGLAQQQEQPQQDQQKSTLRRRGGRDLQSAVTTLRLIDVTTKAVVADLLDGAVIDVLGRGPFNIQAVVLGVPTTTTKSIVFHYQANLTHPFRIESSAPYAFCGDVAGNYTACSQFDVINVPHTVSATPYSLAGGKGVTVGPARIVTFTLTRGMTAPVAPPKTTPAPVPVAPPPTAAPVPPPTPAPTTATPVVPPTTPAPVPVAPPPTAAPVPTPAPVVPPTTPAPVVVFPPTPAPVPAATASPVAPTVAPIVVVPATLTPVATPVTPAPIVRDINPTLVPATAAPVVAPMPSPVTPPTPAPVTPTPAPTMAPTHCRIPKFVGNWLSTTKYPIPAAEAHGAIIGDDYLVISGFSMSYKLATAKNYALRLRDPAAQWRAMDDLPVTAGITHGAFAVVGLKLYMCGGYLGGHPGPHIDTCLVYDHSIAPGSGSQWSFMPPLPQPRSGGGMVFDPDRNALIYAGGAERPKAGNAHAVDRPHAWMYEFATGAWRDVPDMPYLGNHVSYTTTKDASGKVRHFFVGGQVGENEFTGNVKDHYEWDAVNLTWTPRAKQLFTRGHASSSTNAVPCGYIIAGGSTNEFGKTKDISYYDIATDSWTKIGDLPSAVNTPVCGIDFIGGMYYCETAWTTGKFSTKRRIEI